MNLCAKYEERVYAGVLGKVIGVYMGRPIEGWRKEKIVQQFGQIDRYIAPERNIPIVVADDDITGTFTFIRALEESKKYANASASDYANLWLNLIIENKSILWWGGYGVSTEHTAYLNLKRGIPAPQSGSIEQNGQIVAEQIGAQIFIDAFGLAAPNNPELAVKLAEQSARVSHDGEAVYGALVVAAMVSAAFGESDMNQLLDTAMQFIPRDCKIAQVHRDVRAWAAEDCDWHKTYERIKEKYGYDKYAGGCHIIPNHAIMVMAWVYAPNSFLESQLIINTAGWDTDCNAANVGAVMGVKLGLEGICAEYDFQSHIADRLLLPTAEGTRAVSDCLIEALHIARIGRKINDCESLDLTKNGAWHHFSLPGAQHGYLPEKSDSGIMPQCKIKNVSFKNTRMLEVNFSAASQQRPVRISTPVLPEPSDTGYAVMATPKLYPGMIVNVTGFAKSLRNNPVARPFIRFIEPIDEWGMPCSPAIEYGSPITFSKDESPFTLNVMIPDRPGLTVMDFGIEFTGDYADGIFYIDRVTYNGASHVHFVSGILRSQKNWNPIGWMQDFHSSRCGFLIQGEPTVGVCKSEGIGHCVTGTSDWKSVSINARIALHSGQAMGVLVRYQGLRRYIALRLDRQTAQLVLRFDEHDKVLAAFPLRCNFDEFITVSLSAKGTEIKAHVNNELLCAEDSILGYGGAGFCVDSGHICFRDVDICAE